MSYILEALKKSQSDRELGQVPRVQGFGIDVPIDPPRPRPWAYLGLLLALLAVSAGGFLWLGDLGTAAPDDADQVKTPALPAPTEAGMSRRAAASDELAGAVKGPKGPAAQSAAPPPAPQLPSAGPPPAVEPAPAPRLRQPGAEGAEALTSVGDSPAPSEPRVQAEAEPPATTSAPSAARGALPLQDPDHLSVEPEVLVVPAPAKPGEPGEPLPRGAEELRRAALGGERLSASVDGVGALPRPPPPGEPLPGAPPSEHVPVPQDLLAEIEAFKELVRKQDPGAIERPAAVPLPEPPGLRLRPTQGQVALPPAPSLDLRNRLPPFSMTVHVYNPDPMQRFVYINGRKLTERQESREGLRLERVVTDGAVLSYQGERFFQRR